jgi:hypothetical protein
MALDPIHASLYQTPLLLGIAAVFAMTHSIAPIRSAPFSLPSTCLLRETLRDPSNSAKRTFGKSKLEVQV